MGRILANKPLVEALFELKWELKESTPGIRVDEHYKLLIGRIYDRVRDSYPFHEQLPTALMPEEVAAYMVQHRFRREQGAWPLVQVGPGIVTVNDTEGYVWGDFRERISRLIDVYLATYPEPDNLKLNSVLLRYIDAVHCDFESSDVLEFLSEKMNIDIRLPMRLFEDTGVERNPIGIDVKCAFASTQPKGAMEMRLARGRKGTEDVLIWETMVRAVGDDTPIGRDAILSWAEQAHGLTHDWFFKLIAGDLERSFQ